jgi:hypothetical protein
MLHDTAVGAKLSAMRRGVGFAGRECVAENLDKLVGVLSVELLGACFLADSCNAFCVAIGLLSDILISFARRQAGLARLYSRRSCPGPDSFAPRLIADIDVIAGLDHLLGGLREISLVATPGHRMKHFSMNA